MGITVAVAGAATALLSGGILDRALLNVGGDSDTDDNS